MYLSIVIFESVIYGEGYIFWRNGCGMKVEMQEPCAFQKRILLLVVVYRRASALDRALSQRMTFCWFMKLVVLSSRFLQLHASCEIEQRCYGVVTYHTIHHAAPRHTAGISKNNPTYDTNKSN